MTRAIKLDLDNNFEVFDLGPYPHLHDVLGAHFDVAFLNGPIHTHPKHITVGIAVDDEGLLKGLQPNHLATSLAGVFRYQSTPLVGPAVVTASDYEGETIDVPNWTIALVTEIKRDVEEATKYFHDPRWQ